MSSHFLIKGYGSVFHVKDADGDVMMPGAFHETLSRHRVLKTHPLLFFEHVQEPLGSWHVCEEDGHGLWVEGILWHPPPGFLRGMPWSLSIGFELLKSSFVGDARHMTHVNLLEISLVRKPSNPLTALIIHPF